MDGRDRSGPRRFTADGLDDASNDVTDGGGGSAERTARAAHAHRRTAALRHERRTPTGSGRHGEHTDDQNDSGEATDGDGDEKEAAATFGLSTATKLRRVPTAAKGRTRTAATWR
uniref:Retrotransposon protein, putative, Ty3-gypsy subclass n=1 Tax=Oryza sativa subsp. japonica TaxID=39947 RepID=Q6Z3M8_ORYSJ|nr:hypothetical protein [Oryza sativa Japonica Group]BAD05568.1 hypothetical protein [Oryza sativa Japonica Group]